MRSTRLHALRHSSATEWAMRWKPALNAFAITFEGRIIPSGLN